MTLKAFCNLDLKPISSGRFFPIARYVREPRIVVYMRRTNRVIEGVFHSALDIASIQVDRRFQRKGIFKKFLAECFKLCKEEYIYVECVQNEHLKSYLLREGWTEAVGTSLGGFPSFYKVVKSNESTPNSRHDVEAV